MKQMKKVLAVALAVVMALTALVACAPSSASEGGEAKKVLRFATTTEPTSLDPQLGSGTWITNVTGAIFEGLVRRYNGEILPGMAESWEISDDNLTYTFHLRDASWNDDEPITAQDFVDSWNLLIQRATPMAQFTDYFTVDGKANARAVDEKTLEVTLNYPVPFMMEVFAMSATTVVRTDKYEETGDAYYQSVPAAMNGPFLLTEWKANDIMVLEPNPDYWDAEKVNFNRVEIYTVKDDTTQVNMFENGEIDLLTVPDTSSLRPTARPMRQQSTWPTVISSKPFPHVSTAKISSTLSTAVHISRLLSLSPGLPQAITEVRNLIPV